MKNVWRLFRVCGASQARNALTIQWRASCPLTVFVRSQKHDGEYAGWIFRLSSLPSLWLRGWSSSPYLSAASAAVNVKTLGLKGVTSEWRDKLIWESSVKRRGKQRWGRDMKKWDWNTVWKRITSTPDLRTAKKLVMMLHCYLFFYLTPISEMYTVSCIASTPFFFFERHWIYQLAADHTNIPFLWLEIELTNTCIFQWIFKQTIWSLVNIVNGWHLQIQISINQIKQDMLIFESALDF